MENKNRKFSTNSDDNDIYSKTTKIQFQVKYETKINEELYICGNLEELGNWKVEKSPKMETNDSLYPIWESSIQLNCPVGMTIEYKYLLKDKNGKFLEWEKLPNEQSHIITMKKTGDYIIMTEKGNLKFKLIKNNNIEFNFIKSNDENTIKDLKLKFERKDSNHSNIYYFTGNHPIDFIAYENNKSNYILDDYFEFNSNLHITNNDIILMATHNLPIKLNRIGKNDYEIIENENSSFFRLLNSLKYKKNNIIIKWVGLLDGYYDIPLDELLYVEELLEKNNYFMIIPDKKDDLDNFNIYIEQIILPIFINASLDYFNKYLNENEKYFEAFENINIKFAEKIRCLNEENSLIILNDIDLALVPNKIIYHNCQANIGIYIHSVLPASDMWKSIPRYEDIVNSLLLCNVIGFYFFASCRIFTTVLRRFFGLFYQINKKGFMTIQYFGRTILLDVRMGQVDQKYILELTKNEEFINYDKQLNKENKNYFNVISFDYISADQAICNKLCAIDLLCQKNPEIISNLRFKLWIKKFTFDSDFNILTKKYIAKRVDEIQKKYMNNNLIKVEYYHTYNIYKRLATFKNSEVFWYPLSFEGHGIYSNEFCIMQNEYKRYGLILSDNTTSCVNRKNIIKVNPYDFYKMTKAIKKIYYWEPDKERYNQDQLYLKNNTVLNWIKYFLLDLKRMKYYDNSIKLATGLGFNLKLMKMNENFKHLSSNSLVNNYAKSKFRIFFIDYENTFKINDSNILKLLKLLSDNPKNLIFILSNNDIENVSNYFKNLPNIGLCVENGFYYRYPNEKNFKNLVEIKDWSWKDTVLKLLKSFTEKTEDSFIVEKKTSLIWNYHNSYSAYGPLQADELKTHISSIFDCTLLDIINVNGILEIKPKDVNKGAFVAKILQEQFKEKNIDLIVAIGDNETDEDMFNYFSSAEKYFKNFNKKIKTYTAIVIKKPSNAKYFINDSNDLINTIELLTHEN